VQAACNTELIGIGHELKARAISQGLTLAASALTTIPRTDNARIKTRMTYFSLIRSDTEARTFGSV